MDIEIRRPRELSAAERGQWSALQQTSQELDSPFLSPDWALAVEAAEGETSSARVAIFREAGRIRGFMPVAIPHHTARPLGGAMCDYQAAVTERGVAIDPQALIEALDVSRFDFANMLRSQTAFGPYIKGGLPAFAADLSQGYDRYADGQGSGGILGQLDDLRREIQAVHGPLKYKALSRSRVDLDQLLAWRGETLEPWAARLIDDLFLGRDQGFGGALYTLHAGERLIAAQFHLRGQHTLHAWLTAHDRGLDRYWPGLLLTAGVMRWMDDTPYDAIDFGVAGAFTGRQLANVVRNVGIGAVAHPSPAKLLFAAADRLRAAAGMPALADVAAAARSFGGLRALR